MKWEETAIEGAWVITPQVFADDRGSFAETFRADEFAREVGHPFHLHQANRSVSKAGVIRGVHYADVPPSQAKYVTCMAGVIVDYIVDIRVGSSTFGKSVSVVLHADQPRFVYLSEGLGHAFVSLEDGSVASYLVSEPFTPDREHGIHPFDSALGIEWPREDLEGNALEWIVSPKDMEAPGLTEAVEKGLLPTYREAKAYRESLSR